MPSVADLKTQRGFGKIGELAEKKPYLFTMRRRNVALGFSIGLAWGTIPLPIQVFASLFTCYIFKANIPAAILAAFITNPLTSPFILALAYFLGSLFIDSSGVVGTIPKISILLNSPYIWMDQAANYFAAMGEAILIGIPITAILFGVFGYWFISLTWSYSVLKERKERLLQREIKIEKESSPPIDSVLDTPTLSP